jgi:DNA-binding transcriptional regulator YiaG
LQVKEPQDKRFRRAEEKADQLKYIRAGLEMSQDKFAKWLDVSTRTVARWESGNPPYNLILLLEKLMPLVTKRHSEGIKKDLYMPVLYQKTGGKGS